MVLFIPNKHLSLKCHTIVHQTVIVWEGREQYRGFSHTVKRVFDKWKSCYVLLLMYQEMCV